MAENDLELTQIKRIIVGRIGGFRVANDESIKLHLLVHKSLHVRN